MKVRIFLSTATSQLEKDILKNFGNGIEFWIKNQPNQSINSQHIVRIGRWEQYDEMPDHTLEYESVESYVPCDVAVIFGSWKPREKGTHLTRNSVVANAEKFVVIETPLLNRQTDRENTYWRVGINGYLNRDAFWPMLDRSEAKKRLDDLGIRWDGWQNKIDGHIIVALQLPGDASLRGADINDWAYRTVLELRKRTDRPIIIRNHPLCSERAFADHNNLAMKLILSNIQDIKFSDGLCVPWKTDLNGAYCTVTYTSGLAIDSILAGIPTISCDPGNFAYGFSTNTPSEVNRLNMPGKDVIESWLHNLAACQYNLEEMKNGTCWQMLLPVLAKIQ